MLNGSYWIHINGFFTLHHRFSFTSCRTSAIFDNFSSDNFGSNETLFNKERLKIFKNCRFVAGSKILIVAPRK